MKLSFGKIIVILLIIAVPMFVWGTTTQNLETRQFAQETDITPTVTPDATPTVTPSATPTPTNVPDAPPTCSGLSTIPASGTKPLNVSFACAGNDTDNDITAAEFDFGEGNKLLVEKGIGQFGSITATHTYTNSGTYNVTCRVRDNIQKFSTIPDNCKKVVSVRAVTVSTTPTPTKTITPTITDIAIYTGSTSAPTPTSIPVTPTSSPSPAPSTASYGSDYAKFWQLGQVITVSIITIAIGLLLRRAVGGSD